MAGKLVSAVEWWKNDGKWTCSLICYEGYYSQIWLKSGTDLSFDIQPGRYCVGYTTVSSRTSKNPSSFGTMESHGAMSLKGQNSERL